MADTRENTAYRPTRGLISDQQRDRLDRLLHALTHDIDGDPVDPGLERIYFIREARGPVKIGVAANPAKRLRGMRVGNPRPLQLLAWFDVPAGLEERIHSVLSHDQVNGEWFRASNATLALIEACIERFGQVPCPECERRELLQDMGYAQPTADGYSHTCGARPLTFRGKPVRRRV
jgi:hypothetical protein